MVRNGSARLTAAIFLAGSLMACGTAAASPHAAYHSKSADPGGIGRLGSPRSGSPRSGGPWPGGPRSGSPHPGSPQPGGPSPGSPQPGGPEPAGGTLSQAFSTNWSGYVAAGGTYRRVFARWTEPAGNCKGAGAQYSSFWVGLDGFSSATVEQTGSEVDCLDGSAAYYTWYEMYPDMPVFFANKVRPGDHFAASVAFRGKGRYSLAIADQTRHWRRSATVTLRGAANSSAEVIAEAPSSFGGVLPLADFGAVRFTDSLVDGGPLASRHPVKIVMVDEAGRPKDSVSGLSRNGNFTVRWQSAGAFGRRR